MPSSPESPRVASGPEFLEALLAAPRPGSGRVLAFYDSRAGLICQDGRLLFIPLDDHLCHRGDGLFESMAFREGRIFALKEHLARLRKGAAFIGLEPPVPWEAVENLVLSVAAASGVSSGDLRLFLGRGAGGFGVSPQECPLSSLYIVALAQDLPGGDFFKKGLSAISSAIPPKQDYLARIKNTFYLPNVLMAAEAAEKGADVAINFDAQGNLGESAVANVAIVDENGRFRSPRPEGILQGTTLLAAMELARERMPVEQGPVSREDLKSAREILLLTSATLCVPVTVFDGAPVGGGAQGPVAAWLREALLERMLADGVPFR